MNGPRWTVSAPARDECWSEARFDMANDYHTDSIYVGRNFLAVPQGADSPRRAAIN
jgi:hypothetical protein